MQEPNPTDAELDEWEALWRRDDVLEARCIVRLIKALRAYRQHTKETEEKAWEEGWSLAHEPAKCGHARANYKDPKWGTSEYQGDEKCEACAQIEIYRSRVKAKDAVLEEITKRPHSGDAAHPGPHGRKYCNCHVGIAFAALDNLPSVAKQGETDDVRKD